MEQISEKKYKDLTSTEKKQRIKEIFFVFLKLGTLAFGGPVAHTAMMDDEIVRKRKWLDRNKFLSIMSATNLIPGPNSTELAIHLGLERGGLIGLFVAGISFITPAMLIVLAIAAMYSAYGAIPQVENILYGIKPVIISIVLQALIRMAKNVYTGVKSVFIFIFAIALSIMGVGEVSTLVIVGGVTILLAKYKYLKHKLFSIHIPVMLSVISSPASDIGEKVMGSSRLFLIFLKIGSVLYGSGYVLLAFLESEFVNKYGLITNQQLLDAVAVGQFTPGPVFTTATFVGYQINGFYGAMAATVGIFLPSFLLVLVLNPILHKAMKSAIVTTTLEGVNIASLALMAIVSFKLGVSSLVDIASVSIASVSCIALFKTKINSAWLIVAGGIIGYLFGL